MSVETRSFGVPRLYQRPKATLTARFREGARAPRRLRTQARTYVHPGEVGDDLCGGFRGECPAPGSTRRRSPHGGPTGARSAPLNTPRRRAEADTRIVLTGRVAKPLPESTAVTTPATHNRTVPARDAVHRPGRHSKNINRFQDMLLANDRHAERPRRSLRPWELGPWCCRRLAEPPRQLQKTSPCSSTWVGYDSPEFMVHYIEKYGEEPRYAYFDSEDDGVQKMRACFEPDMHFPCNAVLTLWNAADLSGQSTPRF